MDSEISDLFNRIKLNDASIGIGLATLDGRILAFNKAMQKMIGYSENELLQMNLRSTYQNPKDRDQIIEMLQKDGFVRDFEVHLKRKNGEVYYANVTITPISVNGESAILSLVCDITESKFHVEDIEVEFWMVLNSKSTQSNMEVYKLSNDEMEALANTCKQFQELGGFMPSRKTVFTMIEELRKKEL